MTNTGKIVTGVAVGTIIGATLGLLFAPYKGKKTRSIIADKSREAADSIGTSYNKAAETIGSSYNKAKKMVGLKNGLKKADLVS